MNLADELSRQAAEQPYGAAVIQGQSTIHFRELDHLVWRLGKWLRDKGVAPRAMVGLTVADEVRHLIAALALVRLGTAQIALPASVPIAMRNATAKLGRVAVALTDTGATEATEYPVLPIDFEEIGRMREPVSPDIRFDGSSPVIAFPGSGTTGRAKLLEITPEQYLARFRLEQRTYPFQSGDRFLTLIPTPFFIGKASRFNMVFDGVTNVFPEAQPGSAVATCNMLRVDDVFAMPSQLEVMLKNLKSRGDGWRLPYLRRLLVTGSTVGESLRQRVRSTLTNNLVIIYGTNEVGTITMAGPDIQDRHPGAVGRPPEGVSIEIVDGDDRLLPPGEVGEIRVRSAGMIAGYQDDPEATEAAFRDGWFYPRDLGALTADGVLIFHGRADDMMIYDGINIYPREIEIVLEAHPAVAEALAFPVADPMHQDVPAAAVVLRGETSEPLLLAYCRDRLGVHAPTKVMVVAEFPEGVRGKFMRRDVLGLLESAGRPGSP